MMSIQILQPLLDNSDVKNSFIIRNVLSDIVDVNSDQLLTEAFECVEDGNYADALKLYNLVLRHDPANIRALVDKGVTLQNMGRIKSALVSYDEALSISPDNIDAWINKGAALHSDLANISKQTAQDLLKSIKKNKSKIQ